MTEAFKSAYGRTVGLEGVYSNDPADRGGETFYGISRRNWPQWVGWVEVDARRRAGALGRRVRLAEGDVLLAAVMAFYEAHFWGAVLGDSLTEVSPRVAFKTFDVAVNQGPSVAARYLQRSLNLLNHSDDRAELWPDLKVDGEIGEKTLGALRACFSYAKARGHDAEAVVLTWIRVLQGKLYVELMESDRSQEEFAWGWASRDAV